MATGVSFCKNPPVNNVLTYGVHNDVIVSMQHLGAGALKSDTPQFPVVRY